MASNFKVLLITANVGSIFEDPNHTLKLWLAEFFETVRKSGSQIVALHCQEVGGKNFEESMKFVNDFIQALLSSPDLEQYSRVRIFLDEDFTAQEKFTALGSAYFLHNSLSSVEIWDFNASKFTNVPCDSKEVLCGNIEQVPIKEKVKFAKHFFPESQWSRKGFIRTRWHVNGSKFDLINVHLFHDASNVTALEKSPSMYSSYRQHAMEYILQRIENDQYEKYPFFLFGDLNYRLDTRSLIQKLTDKTVPHTTTGKKNEISRIQYTEGDNGKVVLTVDKKTFEHCTHSDLFSDKNISWLRDYDQEPAVFHTHFDEYPITFPPSYPFSENVEEHMTYMTTRCPSWCDRIFLSKTAKTLLAEDDGVPRYEMLGLNTCMGDHKPIMLSFTMKANTAPVPAGRKNNALLQQHRFVSTGGASELKHQRLLPPAGNSILWH